MNKEKYYKGKEEILKLYVSIVNIEMKIKQIVRNCTEIVFKTFIMKNWFLHLEQKIPLQNSTKDVKKEYKLIKEKNIEIDREREKEI